MQHMFKRKIIKQNNIYCALVVLVALFGCGSADDDELATKYAELRIEEKKLNILVEVAETETQRAQGLMFRRFLPPQYGMLFVYEKMQLLTVWMKNTFIAIDVIFISDQGQIVSMARNLKPCQKKPCEIYKSSQKARYMLEVNAGFIDQQGVALGQRIFFDWR